MHLIVVSPEKTLLEENNLESVTLPGVNGPFQVLKNHMNLVSQLVAGKIVYVKIGGKEKKELALEAGGIVTVQRNTITVVLN